MWPKMLFELLPHVGRIMPMAERFFETRKAREQEEQAQLAAITETLRTELDKAAEANSGLERALKEQGVQVSAAAAAMSAVAADVSQTRAALESLNGRVNGLEQKVGAAEAASRRAQSLAVVTLVLLLIVLGLLVVMLVKSGGR